jgi:peptide/nickel transport system substrate-binding protein
LTRQPRHIALFIAALLGCAAAGCGSPKSGDAVRVGHGVPRGGELSVSIRAEPKTFNRFESRDTSADLVSSFIQAKLVRINEATQELEPWLAESWTASADGREYTIALRRNVLFSDGEPFTADDVLFSLRAAYDEKTDSVLSGVLQPAGKKLELVARDPNTIVLTFPVAYAPGLRILENLPIVPRHILEPALEAGTFAQAWGLDTPPSSIVGLGPFVMTAHVPGQRMIFAPNRHYFLKGDDGAPLPYLDRLIVEVIPDQNTSLLRIEAGQLDMMSTEIAPEQYAPLKRAADEGRVKLYDLGVSRNADSLWFNLKPGAFAGDPRADWIQRDELRLAISMAVDRKLFVDTVFLGAGVPVYGPETPANKQWYWPELPHTPYDPAAAKRLLASIGLTDKNGDGTLVDAMGRPAHFTLLTQKGRPNYERAAAVIHDELKKIGLTVDVVMLDAQAVIKAFLTAKYDAVYYNADKTDLDPATNPDFWFSFGSAHAWDLEQKTPATEWEKQIDGLMQRQITSMDMDERRRLYNEVQKIFSEHAPMIFFAAPKIFAASTARVTNVVPAEWRPQLLWRPDTVAVIH